METIKAPIDLTGIERYWREANGGDPYLTLYHRARTLSGSNDNVFKAEPLLYAASWRAACWTRRCPATSPNAAAGRGIPLIWSPTGSKRPAGLGCFFVFDSFEGGLSDKVAADRTARGDTDPENDACTQKLFFASNYEAVEALMRPFPFVSLNKGWIPTVFDGVAGLVDRRFALVHIDVDLYEPTRDSLAFFGPRMSDDGLIVIDDYGSANFPGSKAAVDEYRARRKPKFFLESHLIGAVMMV